MTSNIFKNYLYDLDENMSQNKRKILLILDNAPSHPDIQLKNVELLFLLKNTTSIVQPLDMGIIKSFKNFYYNAMIDSICFCNENENGDLFKLISLKEAMIFISIAWDNVSSITIENCFKKGFSDGLKQFNDENISNNIDKIIKKKIDEVFNEVEEVICEYNDE
ncbi:Tigger transposable element-derived protein 6 [Dictyocoela muelleri]|nr:Tigger transposable element-derived protein 6 [Dictyocoela muelleri]